MQLAHDNQAYFGQHGTTDHHRRIVECCEEVSTNIEMVKSAVDELQNVSHRCDYDADTPGNGFRYC